VNKPFETNYPKWKHLRHGYVVEIVNIYNHRGENGYFSQVVVKGSRSSPDRTVTWSADIFRKNFEPYGRKKKAKTAIDQVLEDPFE
jgi:hypothetical protein